MAPSTTAAGPGQVGDEPVATRRLRTVSTHRGESECRDRLPVLLQIPGRCIEGGIEQHGATNNASASSGSSMTSAHSGNKRQPGPGQGEQGRNRRVDPARQRPPTEAPANNNPTTSSNTPWLTERHVWWLAAERAQATGCGAEDLRRSFWLSLLDGTTQFSTARPIPSFTPCQFAAVAASTRFRLLSTAWLCAQFRECPIAHCAAFGLGLSVYVRSAGYFGRLPDDFRNPEADRGRSPGRPSRGRRGGGCVLSPCVCVSCRPR